MKKMIVVILFFLLFSVAYAKEVTIKGTIISKYIGCISNACTFTVIKAEDGKILITQNKDFYFSTNVGDKIIFTVNLWWGNKMEYNT